MNCQTENCERLPERNGYCATCNRSRRKATAAKAKPARKRIAKQSDPERTAIYNAIRALFLRYNPDCARCKEVYGVYMLATTVHHKIGRLSDSLYDVRHFLPLCIVCHQYVETHPEESYQRGWSELRNANEPHEI